MFLHLLNQPAAMPTDVRAAGGGWGSPPGSQLLYCHLYCMAVCWSSALGDRLPEFQVCPVRLALLVVG